MPNRPRPRTSSWVRIAATPGMRSAADASTERMRARGWGARRVAPQSMSDIHRSEENANSPVTLSVPSGRSVLAPTPRSACSLTDAGPAGAGPAGAGPAGAEPAGAEPAGAEPAGAEPGGVRLELVTGHCLAVRRLPP